VEKLQNGRIGQQALEVGRASDRARTGQARRSVAGSCARHSRSRAD
jgi:hypothetical protein